ncbi:MAG: PorV/PorQ family protein [Candidatus Latescibacteria bacterium]|nr:PorV/PorQ family protein [Candidatus Latescibacterota bacterium]
MIFIILSLIGMLGTQPAWSQTSGQIAIGARPAALGESFVAIADDGYAAYWNPAGLSSLRTQELNSAWADLFGTGSEATYLSYAFPFTDRFVAATDYLHLGFGDEELRFAQNRLGFSAGFRLMNRLSAGISAKWFQLDAGLEGVGNPAGFSSTGTGWGFDLGLLLNPRAGLRIGVVAQDVGTTRIQYENGVSRPLYPLNLRLGTAYQLNRPLLLSGSVDEAAHLGAEYQLYPGLVLRSGVQRELEDAAGLAYSFGVGLRYRFVEVDYAYAQSSGLGSTHRFSLGLEVVTASAIKIQEPELQPIFPALQKRYAHQPLGKVKLTNTSRKPLAATVSLFIPEAMERATELPEPVVVPPGTEMVDLSALFGERLSGWTRNRMVPAQIEVAYTEGNRTHRAKKQGRVTIYKRNAVRWESIGAAASFITPEEETVATFASQVLRSYAEEIHRGGHSSRSLLRALSLFDALSQHGVRYLADANSPYEQVAGKDFVVDSIQYPAELLQKRSGDCDDCTVLYCALLENTGIPTALIDAPGHILMAFDTGIALAEAQRIGLGQGYYLARDERLWVPVEVTLLGKSFREAWRTAVEECLRLEKEGRLIAVDTQEAWKSYPPSSPPFEIAVAVPEKEQALFAADFAALRSLQREFIQQEYLKGLAAAPTNHSLRSACIYNLLELGEYTWALAQLDTMEAQGAPLQTVENNRAVVCILQGELEKAADHLQQVLAADPTDEEALSNLQVVQSRMGQAPVELSAAASAVSKDKKGEAVELDLQDLHWKP